jgi:hypothetical protein
MSHKKTNRYNSGKGTESKVVSALDDMAEFEEFRAGILPKLRQMIKDGKGAEEIYAFSQSILAARAVTIGMQSADERNALAAIREVLDRGVGKAADRVEITQRYAKLSEEELDALIKSQESDLEDAEELSKH